MFGFYVFTFWIGAKLIDDRRINPSSNKAYNIGALLATFMGILMGMLMVMGLQPNIMAFVQAKVLGKLIFDVIDRDSEIKDEGGKQLKDFNLKNQITFENVSFRYPTSSYKSVDAPIASQSKKSKVMAEESEKTADN